MKNILFAAIITLSLGILTSCTKKEAIKETMSIFSLNPYSPGSVLATAD